MKKVTPLILTFTLTLMAGSLAYAMDDDADVRPEYMAMRQDVLAMDNVMRLMEQDVADLQAPTRCRETLTALDGHMKEMRLRMNKVDSYAELSGDLAMSGSLKRLDKATTATMQGMGQCLRAPDKAVPMIRDGVRRMRVALDEIRAGI
jgi:hypothetical protein